MANPQILQQRTKSFAEGHLAAQLNQQDRKPPTPTAGCEELTSLLCMTLTNSSELKSPSSFASNI